MSDDDKKIKTIKMSYFKGFPKDFELDLKGKNVVVFGENGSGKTCIVEGLKLLFDSAIKFVNLGCVDFDGEGFRKDNYLPQEKKNLILQKLFTITGNRYIPIDRFFEKLNSICANGELEIAEKDYFLGKYVERNRFTNFFAEISAEIGIELNNGETLTLKNPENYSGEERMYLEILSRSVAILSYKELMRVYMLKTEEDFFDLFLRKIMAGYQIPPRYEKSLGELIEEFDALKDFLDNYENDKRTKEYKDNLKKYEEIRNKLIGETNSILDETKPLRDDYVKKLTGEDLEIDFKVSDIGKLSTEVRWQGIDVKDPSLILNEGKLTSISLALFLSYYKKFNPSPYKLLLLDDVLIGLDMNLRMPVIDLLVREFSDYQIIMTTYDEHWFNLIKMRLEEGGGWRFSKLIMKDIDNKLPFYIALEYPDNLQKATNHLKNGDIVSAAVYTRIEFERLLRRYCWKGNKKVQYNSDKCEHLWQAIENEINNEDLKKDVKIHRSILLNPSVHFSPKPKYKKEVENTIKIIKELRDLLK